MSETVKRHLISAGVTFVSAFLTTLGFVFTSLDASQLNSSAAWNAAIVSAIFTAGRAAIKAVVESFRK